MYNFEKCALIHNVCNSDFSTLLWFFFSKIECILAYANRQVEINVKYKILLFITSDFFEPECWKSPKMS